VMAGPVPAMAIQTDRAALPLDLDFHEGHRGGAGVDHVVRDAFRARIAAAGRHLDDGFGAGGIDQLQLRFREEGDDIGIFVDMEAGLGAGREIPARDAHALVVHLLGRSGLLGHGSPFCFFSRYFCCASFARRGRSCAIAFSMPRKVFTSWLASGTRCSTLRRLRRMAARLGSTLWKKPDSSSSAARWSNRPCSSSWVA